MSDSAVSIDVGDAEWAAGMALVDMLVRARDLPQELVKAELAEAAGIALASPGTMVVALGRLSFLVGGLLEALALLHGVEKADLLDVLLDAMPNTC